MTTAERIESAEINLMAAGDYFESDVLHDLEVTEKNLDKVEQALDKLHEAKAILETI